MESNFQNLCQLDTKLIVPNYVLIIYMERECLSYDRRSQRSMDLIVFGKRDRVMREKQGPKDLLDSLVADMPIDHMGNFVLISDRHAATNYA
jgi:hypothetical protein